jgi:hypothetical protein
MQETNEMKQNNRNVRMNKHVVPKEDGNWGVKTAGTEKASKIFENKSEALGYAKGLARKHNVCMVVHDEKGKFNDFDCDLKVSNQHVVKRGDQWAVISAGGKEVTGVFDRKGAAMGHAYDLASNNGVCMLVHDKNGKFSSVKCPADGEPGILEVFKMKFGL